MQKKLPAEWVRSIKKTMNRLQAAETFGDFLSLRLGHPERLSGYGDRVVYSVHITGNVRIVFELDADNKTITVCSELEIEKVVDYHGSKETVYLA